MQSKLVRVVAEETPDVWGAWAAATVHNRIKKDYVARFFPQLVPTKRQIKSAGATVVSAATGIRNLFRKSGSDQIGNLTVSEASFMVDAEGHALALGLIYAAHPLVSGVMLKADTLHTYIIKEQRAQIIRYFRSAVALKSLTIEVVCHNSGKCYAGGGWKVATAQAGQDSSEEQRHWFTASYNSPRKEALAPSESQF